MKKAILTALTAVLLVHTGNCQMLTAGDSLVLQMPEASTRTTKDISAYVMSHYSSDSARVRALFVWVANNISYDIEKLRSGRSTLERTPVEDVLKTRKAVCQGYSELFVELCSLCNIRAVLIPGYDKHPDGTISDLTHAWVAANVHDTWCLYDPTWSAGSVNDDHFSKRFTNRFYKVPPEEMIKDHMPFDPMYQFLYYPVTNAEFAAGKTGVNTAKKYFSYRDTMYSYNALSVVEQSRNAVRRIENNGVTNENIRKQVEMLKMNLGSMDFKTAFDGAAAEYQKAIALYNQYIHLKNDRFSSVKEKKEVGQLIDSVFQHEKKAKLILTAVVAGSDRQKAALDDISNSIAQFTQRAEDEKLFVTKWMQAERSSVKN